MDSESGTRRNFGDPVARHQPTLAEAANPGRDAVEWAVGSVSERLGVAPATLRTWDRRYAIGPSQRTEGGHRRYTEEDIRRVRVMARFTARGVPAQSAARVALSMDSDRLLIETGQENDLAPPLDHDDGTISAVYSAALSLDPGALSRIYQRTLRERDLVSAWNDVFVPALRNIGEQWGQGSLGVESEHLATEVLVTELRAVIRGNRPRSANADVILASADEEQHYLPLLALEAELARQGLGAVSLGARVPTTALSDVLTSRHPSRLFLWASLAREADEALWTVLAGVHWPLTVVLGGPGWPADLPPAGRSVTVTRAHTLADAAHAMLTPMSESS
ncbi:MAG: MerR family transcriptional regulator [Pedococcus sp.]